MKFAGIFLVLLALAAACTEDDGMKGSLKLSITDSPADADNVKGVNLYITHVDALINGQWKSLRRFEQVAGINLLQFTGGKSSTLIDQYIDPGQYTTIKFGLNLADPNSALIKNPQCNIEFTDGTTAPIYFSEEGSAELILSLDMRIQSRALTDITFDFDVRKSLIRDDQGNILFKPSVRIIETIHSGLISATVANDNPSDRLVVFAYPSGTFTPNETSDPAAGEVRFPNAINSSKVKNGKFALGFMPSGSYDLVFAKHSPTGEYIGLAGRWNTVSVADGETNSVDVDLDELTGS